MNEMTPIGMNLFDIERWNYQNKYFFHKGRWITQEMLDTEAWMKRTAEIFNDPTLTRVEKLQKALGRKRNA